MGHNNSNTSSTAEVYPQTVFRGVRTTPQSNVLFAHELLVLVGEAELRSDLLGTRLRDPLSVIHSVASKLFRKRSSKRPALETLGNISHNRQDPGEFARP